MKILLLGGTGAMGTHLARLAVETGAEVVVTSRRERPAEGSLRYVKGNARDDDFTRIILRERWDAIVDFMVYTTDAFRQRANFLLGATSQYLYLSSARVYADSSDPITESSKRLRDVSTDSEYLATDEYALAKARQEDVLLSSQTRNWTIIRPYITYGEERMQLGVLEKEGWLYRALHGKTIVFSQDIHERYTTLTYGLDVARGILAVIGKPEAMGEAFHITGENSLSWGDVLSSYLDVLEPHLKRRPQVLLQDLRRFQQVHPARYQIKYDRLYNRRFDNSKIGRFIDIGSFMTPENGLRQCLTKFLGSPEFLQINWRAEAKKDRQAGEWPEWSELGGIGGSLKYLAYRYLQSN